MILLQKYYLNICLFFIARTPRLSDRLYSAASKKRGKGRRRKNADKRRKTLRWKQNKRKKANRAKRSALGKTTGEARQFGNLFNGCPITEMCIPGGAVTLALCSLLPTLCLPTPPSPPPPPPPPQAQPSFNPITSFAGPGGFAEVFGKTYLTEASEATALGIFTENLRVVEVS